MQMSVHALKKASGHVGASRIHYACYYIEEAYKVNDFDGMIQYYPLLVEAIVEFKRFS